MNLTNISICICICIHLGMFHSTICLEMQIGSLEIFNVNILHNNC